MLALPNPAGFADLNLVEGVLRHARDQNSKVTPASMTDCHSHETPKRAFARHSASRPGRASGSTAGPRVDAANRPEHAASSALAQHWPSSSCPRESPVRLSGSELPSDAGTIVGGTLPGGGTTSAATSKPCGRHWPTGVSTWQLQSRWRSQDDLAMASVMPEKATSWMDLPHAETVDEADVCVFRRRALHELHQEAARRPEHAVSSTPALEVELGS